MRTNDHDYGQFMQVSNQPHHTFAALPMITSANVIKAEQCQALTY